MAFSFKVLVLLLYLATPYLQKRIMVFELIVFLSILDFWIVKNYCGRALTGLWWWVNIDEDTGKEQWVFETRVIGNVDIMLNRVHYRVFWFTQLFLGLMFLGIMVANFLTGEINLVLF